MNNTFIHRLNIKKMKLCSHRIVSCHVYIVHAASDIEASEIHLITSFRRCHPAVMSHPWIGLLVLKIVPENLLEQSHVICKTYTVTI